MTVVELEAFSPCRPTNTTDSPIPVKNAIAAWQSCEEFLMIRNSIRFRTVVHVSLAVSCVAATVYETHSATPAESDVEIASRWWPAMENVWTPIGWKNHRLRANVLYNGMVVIEPRRQPEKGKGVQIEFIPSAVGMIPESPRNFTTRK